MTTIVRTAQPGNPYTKKKQHEIIIWEAAGGTRIIDLNGPYLGSMVVTLI